MPTYTVKSDGTGDYTSLKTAISTEATDLSVSGQIVFDCATGDTFNELIANADFSGYSNASSTNNVVIQGNGSRLHAEVGSYSAVFRLALSYLVVNDLIIDNDYSGTSTNERSSVQTVAGCIDTELNDCTLKFSGSATTRASGLTSYTTGTATATSRMPRSGN